MTLLPPDHRRGRLGWHRASRRESQRGVTLLFALITLVALLFATLALVRSVDTSTLLLGNIGFKQDATATADQATRKAIAWLTTNSASLTSDDATHGYYASTKELQSDGTIIPVDATGQQLAGASSRQIVNWDTSCSTGICSTSTTTSANTARYVVFRLCSKGGDNNAGGYTGTCAKPLTSSGQSAVTRGGIDYTQTTRLTGGAGPYYRIVVRVQGARNTTSFTETIVHF